MTRERTDLLPCPFCGGAAKGWYGAKAEVSCTVCGVSLTVSVPPGIFRSYIAQRDHETHKAMEAWNRRVDAEALNAISRAESTALSGQT